MRKRTTMKLGFVITWIAAASLIAAAEPRPAFGWPDQHPSSYLGVHIDEVTPQTASTLKLSDTSGALITYVDQDGPACKAGLKNNDVVVGFNGSKVQSPDQLQDLIHATPAGKTVNLAVDPRWAEERHQRNSRRMAQRHGPHASPAARLGDGVCSAQYQDT